MNKEDILFYESELVMKVALSFVPKNKKWEDMSSRFKQMYINKSVDILFLVVNDKRFIERIIRAKNDSHLRNNS